MGKRGKTTLMSVLLLAVGSLSYAYWFSEVGSATPMEAVQAFRDYEGTLIHEIDVDGGKVLFIQRDMQEDVWHLEAEYVKKTWRGWIWGYGGGHSVILGTAHNTNPWTYQYFPSTEGTDYESPFPMLFGLMDPVYHSISVHTHTTAENHRATVTNVEQPGFKLWYMFLSEEEGKQFTLTALSEANEILATEYIDEDAVASGGDLKIQVD